MKIIREIKSIIYEGMEVGISSTLNILISLTINILIPE